MTKWIELGGFYEGMDEDARSKHLANIISKRCPGCNAQIEKDEGCLQLVINPLLYIYPFNIYQSIF